MAIVISSLTPTNPTTSAGGSVQFNIDASDDGGLTLSYEWQYSTDGVNYLSSGLSDNTSNSYNTGPLTVSQNGIYYRCVVSTTNGSVNSNEYPGIGDRSVIVFQDPSILIEVDPTVDFLPSSQVKTVGDTLILAVSATLANVDLSTDTLVSGIGFQWQKSQDSGSTWTNISAGGNTTITEQTALINSTTSYMKYSTLNIQNISFADNLSLYRVRVSYSGAINTPVDSTSSQLIIDPVINIIRQPGVDVNDTQITNCYKTSIADSGDVRVSVSALTTVGTALSYRWEVNFAGPAGEDNDENWLSIGDVTSGYMFILKPGTTANTDVLQLERFIYFEQPGFRCVISGTNGEATVITEPHYIYMTDVQGYVDVPTTSYDIAEDKYGDIVDRDIYINDPIQTLVINAEVDIQRNTGQNGNNTFTWQRKNPGSSVWVDITDPEPVITETDDSAFSYTQFPNTLPEDVVSLRLQTPPLRRDVDNGAKYRVKVESSSLFTLNGAVKTITPYYSSEITINVYRTVYITNQPTDSNQYPNYSTGFSVSASPSSGNASDITYQWQYNTVNSSTGWVNISNNSPYTGATTNLLTINPVPSSVTRPFFRCVMNITNGLSSVTTEVAELTILRDYFTALSSLNDVVLREFSNHTFSVTASSVSVGPISYQWQKSTNFNPANSTGTWSNISGETTSSLTLLSIGPADDAYYRVKCTSSGGEVLYSNAAKLTIQEVNITISQNIVTSISILEGQQAAYRFVCEGLSSINTEVSYQWQIKRVGDVNYSNIGAGYNNSLDNDNEYVLRALDNTIDNGAKIRCRMSAPDVPTDVYTNECTITVIRRFTYFADTSTKTVTIGDNLTIDLNPTFTGGNPSYSWEENGVVMGETSDTLVIPNITSAYNGRVYRCKITLDGCTQHRYSRNNTITTVNVTPPDAYTVTITISTVTAPFEPIYYSNETAKSGAAIGTVICIPKPSGYVEDASARNDDINRWNLDRFPGYLPLRGDSFRALDYPELARQYGTKFGGTITGTFPNYNSSDTFKLPMTYGKRLIGTGNVNNNKGSVSVVPLYNPDGTSGGDKNVPGSMGGQYNYTKSAQLPPGSPGVAGESDGTADGFINAQTFSIGSYRTTGMRDVNAFAQPTFSGSVSYFVPSPSNAFTDLPTHSHSAVSVGWLETQPMITGACAQAGYPKLNPDGPFHVTEPDGGLLEESFTTEGADHGHGIASSGPGSFDMVVDGGMGISDTTLRFTGANESIMNNNLRFTLRNNEQIPLNAPYFRLKYMVKAY